MLAPTRRAQRRAHARRSPARALERNLDIAVERLNPQLQDFNLARLRAAYRPTAQLDDRPPCGRAAADQPVERRQHRAERHVDLQRRHHPGAAGGGGTSRSSSTTTSRSPRTSSPTSTRPIRRTSTRRSPSRCCAASDRQHAQQLRVTAINRDISEIQLRGHDRDHAGQRSQLLLGARVRDAGGGRRARLARPRREAGGGQPGAGRGRHAGAARRRAGGGGGGHAPPDVGAGRGDAGHRGARAQAPDRQRHRRSAVACDASRRSIGRSSRRSARRRGAVRRRSASGPISSRRADDRQQRRHHQVLPRNQTLPALDVIATYARRGSAARSSSAQGTGLGSTVIGTIRAATPTRGTRLPTATFRTGTSS